MFSFDGRVFEHFVAAVFELDGLEADLTPPTRDNGYDIVVLHEQLAVRTRWLLECKRYAAERIVSRDVLQKLLGAVTAERANKGVVVTTSDFSADAREFGKQNGSLLTLLNFTDITKWWLRAPLAT
jgi:restriction system protein